MGGRRGGGDTARGRLGQLFAFSIAPCWPSDPPVLTEAPPPLPGLTWDLTPATLAPGPAGGHGARRGRRANARADGVTLGRWERLARRTPDSFHTVTAVFGMQKKVTDVIFFFSSGFSWFAQIGMLFNSYNELTEISKPIEKFFLSQYLMRGMDFTWNFPFCFLSFLFLENSLHITPRGISSGSNTYS